MRLIDAVGLKIRLGKRYAYDERRIREIFKETIDDMPTVEAIPVEYIQRWMDEHHEYMNVRPLRFMVQDYRMEKKDDDV